MNFYPHLVAAYDEVFPLTAQMVQLAETPWHGRVAGLRFLDAGCGTGSMAIALARHGARVNAFDLSDEMVAEALKKQPQALNLCFKTGSLLTMTNLYAPAQFDGLFCIGNTLAHLTAPGAVEHFMHQAGVLLKPDGSLFIQLINADRIQQARPAGLPTIDTENYLFERMYGYPSDEEIEFSFHLTPKSDGLTRSGTTMLKMLTRKQLEAVMGNNWKLCGFWGDWSGKEWQSESYHTIVWMKKHFGS